MLQKVLMIAKLIYLCIKASGLGRNVGKNSKYHCLTLKENEISQIMALRQDP